MILRGPTGHRVGSSHPKALLSTEDVELIRQLRDAGLSLGEIARKFEVPRSTVQSICSHRVRNYG